MSSRYQLVAGKASPIQSRSDRYQAGPCNDECNFLEKLLDGLAIDNPSYVLHLHKRLSNCDLSSFLDISAYGTIW